MAAFLPGVTAARPPSGPRTGAADSALSEVLASTEGQRPWGSFHLATMVFRRAQQLRGGARPRVDARGHKTSYIAFLEVTSGAIPWEVGRG